MNEVIVTLYDKHTGLYSPRIVTSPESTLDALIGQFRREVRDAYIKGELTEDMMREYEYVKIGEIDTKTGQLSSYMPCDYVRWPMMAMVRDLVMKNDN